MALTKPLQSSVNAGELSPLLSARSDIGKYKSGLLKLLNAFPLIQGGWTRRPGSYYTAPTKANGVARLQRFEFSTTQTYMIELGNLYARFYKDHGAIILTGQNITAATKASQCVITYAGADTFANGDDVEISGVVGMTQLNGRRFTVSNLNAGANTFEPLDPDGVTAVNSTNYGTYISGGTVSEVFTITLPYLTADLFQLKFTQSADTLYITHPSYPPRKLTRAGHTQWDSTVIQFLDGPYLATNATSTTMTPSAAKNAAGTAITGYADNGAGLIRITAVGHGLSTNDKVVISETFSTYNINGFWIVTTIDADHVDLQGSVYFSAPLTGGNIVICPTITASSIKGINSDTGFQSGDVGRLIRLQQGSTWGWVRIGFITSTTVVSVDIVNTLTSTAAKAAWRLGVWSGTTGYPAAVCFNEDRLCFGGATLYPQRVDMSNSGDYENFAPSSTAGVVGDSNAIAVTLNANDVNAIRWLQDDDKGLLIGTVGGEWILRASTIGEAISPTNITAKRSSTYGSANVQAIRAGDATLYLQRAGRKLRELAYVFESDKFKSPDMTVLSEHITLGGLIQLSFQQETQATIWAPRTDGQLIGFTYEREQEVLGWHRSIFGGVSDSAGMVIAKCESASSIPAPDITRDESWVIVNRYINGKTRRYVEYMTKPWEKGDNQSDAFFVDSGLSLNNTIAQTLTPGTGANVKGSTGVIFTAGGAVFVVGDVARFIHYDWSDIDGNKYRASAVITGYTDSTHVTATILSEWPNLTLIASAGWRMSVSTVSGLWHLEGQTVSIFGDGGTRPDAVVTNGSVTLSYPASKIAVGLGYNSDGQRLRDDSGVRDGTAQGKVRRPHRVVFRLLDTLGISVGPDFDHLTRETFRTSSDPSGVAPPLFTGDWPVSMESHYDTEGYVCWRQDQPEPMTVLMIAPELKVSDR